jgi:hypothetical protein
MMGMKQLKECLRLEDYSSALKREALFFYETFIFMCPNAVTALANMRPQTPIH